MSVVSRFNKRGKWIPNSMVAPEVQELYLNIIGTSYQSRGAVALAPSVSYSALSPQTFMTQAAPTAPGQYRIIGPFVHILGFKWELHYHADNAAPDTVMTFGALIYNNQTTNTTGTLDHTLDLITIPADGRELANAGIPFKRNTYWDDTPGHTDSARRDTKIIWMERIPMAGYTNRHQGFLRGEVKLRTPFRTYLQNPANIAVNSGWTDVMTFFHVCSDPTNAPSAFLQLHMYYTSEMNYNRALHAANTEGGWNS